MNYDIIGDVHGHADKLEGLLARLQYQTKGGLYSHLERKAVFLGDLIDRGKQNYRVIDIVRNMVNAGSAHAIMGNHEYNAICFHTVNQRGEYLRAHTDKNTEQHQAFLDEFAKPGAPKIKEIIEWFKTLPLFLETPHFRAIHACWSQDAISSVREYLNSDNTLKEEHLEKSSIKDPDNPDCLFNTIETLLKGVEIKLPGSRAFLDKDNNPRQHIRVRWWGEIEGMSYKDLAVGYEEEALKNIPSDEYPEIQEIPLYQGKRPVFFGHYWMNKEQLPQPQQKNACCLDYSAGKGGKLVCYKFSVDQHEKIGKLIDSNFVSYPVL